MCVCVCVCVHMNERERKVREVREEEKRVYVCERERGEGGREREREANNKRCSSCDVHLLYDVSLKATGKTRRGLYSRVLVVYGYEHNGAGELAEDGRCQQSRPATAHYHHILLAFTTPLHLRYNMLNRRKKSKEKRFSSGWCTP